MSSLWIRTQKRDKLIMVSGVSVENIKEDEYDVVGFTVGNYLPVILGTYDDGDYAYTILDDIQELFESIPCVTRDKRKDVVLDNNVMFYEMPED